MNQWDGIDPVRTRLRVLVGHVESAIAKQRTPEGARNEALEQAWLALVAELALGHEPEVRSCPFCRRSILLLAVRCRYCMKSSPVEQGPVTQ
jgi:hypothetical protein